MKLSINWLRETVNPDIDNNKLSAQLTMAGLEVEALEPACAAFEKVYTAEIIKVDQHPNADKLKLCTVRLNHPDFPEDLPVVCGDPTVSIGSKVALATIGAKLNNGDFKIKKSKLRGVESHGMLCSLSELGLAETSSGIWVLPDNIETGLDLYEFLDLNDEIIEIGLTPNRGDCFSLRGIAREVAVINKLNYNADDVNRAYSSNSLENLESKLDSELSLNISIDNKNSCPRYAGRIIKNLDPKAVTPFWMRERLRRSGIRSLYPLVDVTNYVMIELGQPMHAFDLNNIDSEIIVRSAQNNEKLKLLDETELTLTSDNLMICDKNGPLALAGVMGGDNSAISEDTSDVFLESAFFNPESIAKTARQFNIVTDSSQRFERGVDPSITLQAIERATALLLEIAGTADTTVGSISEVNTQGLEQKQVITLRHNRIKRILGIDLDTKLVEEILFSLGLNLLDKEQDGHNILYKWQVPSHRFDLNLEEDLLEELARVYGYNKIPSNTPKRGLELKAKQPKIDLAQKIRTNLSNQGYLEALTYSFIDSKLQSYFAPTGMAESAVKLINPISSEMGELRLSLCPGLISLAEYNTNHQASHIKMFEIGKCFYLNEDGSVTEHNKLAGILTGTRTTENWTHKTEKFDFYDAKGNLESLFNGLGLTNHIEFAPCLTEDLIPGLHPGRSACIIYNNKKIGWVACTHPEVNRKTNLDNSVILFELSLEELQIPSYTEYMEISKFPQIRRDLAFLLKNEINVQNLCDLVAKVVGDLLKNTYVFDIYQGTGIPDGYKSVAFGIILQHQTKTLVDEEIVSIVNKVVKEVTDKLGGKLRE